jgi:hypothetical protein
MPTLSYDSKEVLTETTTTRAAGSRRSARTQATTGSEIAGIAGEPLSQTFIERLRLTKRYLDAREVVGILGVHITTLQLWTKHRQIPHLRVGHGIRFDPVELADWLATRQIGTR